MHDPHDRLLELIKFATAGLLSLAFTVLVAVLAYRAAVYGLGYGRAFGASLSAEKPSNEITIMLAKQATVSDVAKILKANGVINNPYVFIVDSYFNGSPKTFQPGTYVVNTDMSDIEISNALSANAGADETRITVSDGFTIKNIGDYLENNGVMSAKAFTDACANDAFNYDFLAGLPAGSGRLEGFLFPDTYFIAKNATADDVIDKLLSRFGQIYTPEYRQRARAMGLTTRQIVTVASLAQSETNTAEEFPTVTGLIYNRLAAAMPLNLYSPLTYALHTRQDNLTDADYQNDTPYNTFTHKGLPPGPVCNPGPDALAAALYPEKPGPLYMVVKDAKTRAHFFTNSPDDYAAALKQYNQKY